ncbi:hypothetical protein [Burkholderia anthina]|uniref:hypothetical protein n=1 Tax=Burkholderia anthina TaxID=179879 RepID=UPI00158EA30E|nr:hypothetical protein [Burkholderia anthina]
MKLSDKIEAAIVAYGKTQNDGTPADTRDAALDALRAAIAAEQASPSVTATLGEFDPEPRLRDEFAAHAIQGILANEGAVSTGVAAAEWIGRDCQRAYAYADGVMRARGAE